MFVCSKKWQKNSLTAYWVELNNLFIMLNTKIIIKLLIKKNDKKKANLKTKLSKRKKIDQPLVELK